MKINLTAIGLLVALCCLLLAVTATYASFGSEGNPTPTVGTPSATVTGTPTTATPTPTPTEAGRIIATPVPPNYPTSTPLPPVTGSPAPTITPTIGTGSYPGNIPTFSNSCVGRICGFGER